MMLRRSGRSGLMARTALALVLSACAIATPAMAQDLKDTLAAAYQNNPQLLAERAQLSATDEDVAQAVSGWRPTVQLNANAGISHNNTANGLYIQTAHPTGYGATVSEPVFQGGHTVFATHQATALVESERAHLISIEENVLLTAVTDYVNVFTAQATLDLNINNEKVYRQQLDYSRDRLSIGEVTRTDVAQSEAAVAQAVAGREQALTSLEIARASYRQDVGIDAGQLTAPDIAPDLPGGLDETKSATLDQNPNIVAANFARQAAKEDILVVRSQLLPQLSLDASVSHTNDSLGTFLPHEPSDTESVTANLTVPLYEAGSVYSQSRQAQDTLLVRENNLDQARAAAVQSAVSAWQQLQAAHADVVSFRSQIDSNRVALEGVQAEAGAGERTVLDILNAEQALFQSNVNLVQAQHDELIAKFSVAAATGDLTAKSLALPVALFDPEKNFRAVRHKWIGFGTGN